MTETPEAEPTTTEPSAPTDPISAAVAPGYQFEGAALELGGLMLNADDLGDVPIRIPLAMLNRHGLVAGATGTGKTKTLQLLAEQLSAHGVPVFAADIKGDLSGLSAPGESSDKLTARTASVGQQLDGDRLPDGVLRDRRPGHRRTRPRHHDRVRPDPARQGARSQRDAGVVARAGLLLLRQAGAAAARPRGPARGPAVPHRRRGREGRAEVDRRPVPADRRASSCASWSRSRRRAPTSSSASRSSRRATSSAPPTTASASSACSSCPICRTGRPCSRRS